MPRPSLPASFWDYMTDEQRKQWNQCGAKRSYFNRSHARHYSNISEKINEFGDRFNPYECPWCPFWHVGHTPNQKETP